MDNLAFLFSLGSAAGFALYVVPRKLTKQDDTSFTFYMSCIFALTSLVLFVLFDGSSEAITPKYTALSALTGLVWVAGFVCYIKSIQQFGLLRANLWKNTDNFIGVLLPLVFLGEWSKVSLPVIGGSIVLITIGAYIFSKYETDDVKAINKKKGIMFAVGAATIFGINALLAKMCSMNGMVYSQLVVKSFSVVVLMLVIMLFSRKKINMLDIATNKFAYISGFIYAFGNLCLMQGFGRALGSYVWVINQLDAVILFTLGVFVFKELKYRDHWVLYTIGIIMTIAGALII